MQRPARPPADLLAAAQPCSEGRHAASAWVPFSGRPRSLPLRPRISNQGVHRQRLGAPQTRPANSLGGACPRPVAQGVPSPIHTMRFNAAWTATRKTPRALRRPQAFGPLSCLVHGGEPARRESAAALTGAACLARALCLFTLRRNLVDPASSHTLVSKIKPCMSKYKHLYRETANGSLYQL